MTDPVGEGLGTVDHELQVLGGDGVGNDQGLGRSVDHHRPACRGQRGGDVVTAGGALDDAGHLGLHGVRDRLVPSDQPGQAVRTVLGLDHDVDGGECGRHGGVSHHNDLRGTGESRWHADQSGNFALG